MKDSFLAKKEAPVKSFAQAMRKKLNLDNKDLPDLGELDEWQHT